MKNKILILIFLVFAGVLSVPVFKVISKEIEKQNTIKAARKKCLQEQLALAKEIRKAADMHQYGKVGILRAFLEECP